jgi:hypothetical protein
MHFRARSYDPRVGRFGSRDSILLLFHYTYANNNPLRLSDPFGLQPTAEEVAHSFGRAYLVAAAKGVPDSDLGLQSALLAAEDLGGAQKGIYGSVIINEKTKQIVRFNIKHAGPDQVELDLVVYQDKTLKKGDPFVPEKVLAHFESEVEAGPLEKGRADRMARLTKKAATVIQPTFARKPITYKIAKDIVNRFKGVLGKIGKAGGAILPLITAVAQAQTIADVIEKSIRGELLGPGDAIAAANDMATFWQSVEATRWAAAFEELNKDIRELRSATINKLGSEYSDLKSKNPSDERLREIRQTLEFFGAGPE